jgi:hypothetical protein
MKIKLDNMKGLSIGLVVLVVAVLIGIFAFYQNQTVIVPKNQIVVQQSGGAGLLIAECSNKSYIVETADYIVEGTVEKVESKWNAENTSIFTYTTLVIEKYVKGAPFSENQLQIVTPGGAVGSVLQQVEDQPIFHEGKRVRIYFQKINEEFSIVCANMGVEEISVLTTTITQNPIEVNLDYLVKNPALYVNKYVKMRGYVVKNVGAFFGDRYYLQSSEGIQNFKSLSESSTGMAISSGNTDLENFVQFTFNGTGYTGGPQPRLYIDASGFLRDRGTVTDVSRYILEIDNVVRQSPPNIP